jgi:two-component system nitrate/nitrite response regulator NarL
MQAIQLLVVDDHSLFRRGLTALLRQDGRLDVIAQAGDIGEALRCLERATPDVILLDNNLPGVRGVDGIAALKDACPGVRILMLTLSEAEEDLAAALRAGADGYLLKTVESEQLCESIVKVLAGESIVSPDMMTKLVAIFRSHPNAQTPAEAAPSPTEASGMDLLSAREREVLALIARGDTNKLIARQLDIAETTVKIHVQRILRKLQLSSRVQAAVFVSMQGNT